MEGPKHCLKSREESDSAARLVAWLGSGEQGTLWIMWAGSWGTVRSAGLWAICCTLFLIIAHLATLLDGGDPAHQFLFIAYELTRPFEYSHWTFSLGGDCRGPGVTSAFAPSGPGWGLLRGQPQQVLRRHRPLDRSRGELDGIRLQPWVCQRSRPDQLRGRESSQQQWHWGLWLVLCVPEWNEQLRIPKPLSVGT